MSKENEQGNGQTQKRLGRLTSLISTIVSRSDLANRAGLTFEGKRDLYKELGYLRVLDYVEYNERYQRGGIASRIVDAFPMATWRNPPIVTVKGQEEFEKIWNELALRLKLFHYLERVDRLAGIGRYAVLFLGVSGAKAPETSIQKVKGPENVLFLSTFSEINACVRELEKEPTNSRFGLPSAYDVKFLGGVSVDKRELNKVVHASRVIHVADGVLEDDIFGSPRLKKVWNYLDDLEKVIGGASEAVWRTVDRGIQFDLDKDLELTTEDEEDFSDEIEEYFLGFKRYIKTKGITTKVLGSDVPNPSGPVESIIGLISGTTGIPQRILMGSERGELSSGQDERNFNSRVRERQLSYAEPVILRPLLDRFISIGALPEPTDSISIKWPDLAVITDKELADIAARAGQAIANVSAQGKNGMIVVPARLFAERWLGIDPDDFDAAVKQDDMLIEASVGDVSPEPVTNPKEGD